MVPKKQSTSPVQPQYAAQPDPNAQYGPAPQSQQTPYEQQPVNQQYFAQPQAAPVQYVVMAESLKGVRGWLLFFVIVLGCGAIGSIGSFFTSITDLAEPTNVVNAVMLPFVILASIAAVVLIALQKRLGRWMAMLAIGIVMAYAVTTQITEYATSSGIQRMDIPLLISTIISALLMLGGVMLYFIVSRRVKETLIG